MAKLLDSQLEIDPRIREQKELLDNVLQASERLAEESASFGPNVQLAWRLPRGDDSRYELTITEVTHTGTGTASRKFPIRYLRDSFCRNSAVRELWDEILAARFERSDKRLGELIARLAEEEEQEELAHAR